METRPRIESVIAIPEPRDQKAIDHELATRVLGLTLQVRPGQNPYWAQPHKPDTCFIRADDWNPCVDTSPHFLPQNQWVLVMERMIELGFIFSIQLGRKLPEDWWVTGRPQVYVLDYFLATRFLFIWVDYDARRCSNCIIHMGLWAHFLWMDLSANSVYGNGISKNRILDRGGCFQTEIVIEAALEFK
jgi:hypothetical protein